MSDATCKDRERFLTPDRLEEKTMATIDQPTPSRPGSPQPDRQPLQPGGPVDSRNNSAEPERVNHTTPESTNRDKSANR
jgi:hypothetical protein